MSKEIVVFGAGKIAATVCYYLERWQLGTVAAFMVDAAYRRRAWEVDERLVVAFEEAIERFPPDRYDAFVAIGYQDLNGLRAEKVQAARGRGYKLINVINPGAPSDMKVGENCLVVPDESLLEPGATLGNNVFIWNGASVSHFTHIEDDCWLSNGALVGGSARIGARTFVGLGAMINHNVTLGRECILGTGACLTRDLPEKGVAIAPETPRASMDSDRARALLT